ncbi:hypothetical protein ABU614_08760 [Lysobacter firmicutimachus]|uniref:DUF4398 domain-containing protein n=1 Tax=Lysobacter firmicutimachus TaxID=1792846 RepID=A0AAU8MZ15_9GAMM
MKPTATVIAIASLSLAACAAAAQYPVRDIWYSHHPNLARAQDLVAQAYGSVRAARQANEYQLGGHAAKAEQYLYAASRELKQAANTANREGR